MQSWPVQRTQTPNLPAAQQVATTTRRASTSARVGRVNMREASLNVQKGSTSSFAWGQREQGCAPMSKGGQQTLGRAALAGSPLCMKGRQATRTVKAGLRGSFRRSTSSGPSPAAARELHSRSAE